MLVIGLCDHTCVITLAKAWKADKALRQTATRDHVTICLPAVADSKPTFDILVTMKPATKQGMFSPDTASTRLHRALRVRMCEGDFTPGEVISIRRIAAEYGTSAMPAREAVRWLVTEGALVFSDSRKIIVPELCRERFQEVLYARKNLEAEVSRQAFPAITAEDIDELERIDARINAAIEQADISRYMRNNYQFHFHIYRLSQSRVLLPLIEMGPGHG